MAKQRHLFVSIGMVLLLLAMLPLAHVLSQKNPPEVLGREEAEIAASREAASSPLTVQHPQQRAAAYESLHCLFFDPDRFPRSVATAGLYAIDGPLLAGVTPHHLVADRLIATFFRTAAQWADAYDTIVLLGPNHSGVGGKLITCSNDFGTPFGNLPCDLELTQRLLSCADLPIASNPRLIEEDHALSTLVPYIKYYLPQIKMVTLLLSRDVNEEEALRVASLLADTKRCLVVGSIDFSHYLSPDEAAQKDAQTWEAIQAGDYAAISHMKDDHLDSPGSLLVILNLIRLVNGPDVELLEHSEASQFQSGPLDEGTTSYFVLGATAP